MRLFGSIVTAAVFLVPFAVAQHAGAPVPAPVHVSPIAMHTSSATSAGMHGSSPSSPHIVGTNPHPGALGSRSVPQTSALNTERAKPRTLPVPSTNSRPEKADFFSFLHRNRRDRCKGGSCAAVPSTVASVVHPAADIPVASNPHTGCNIVPTFNPGIPCNPYAPCCP